jgi:hypothetical protein
MPDDITPVEPAPEAPQQPASPQETDWEARYKGSVRKIEELTLSSRTTEEQLAAKASEIEQLRVQLTAQGAEKDAAVNLRDQQIEETVKSSAQLKAELEQLQAFKLKAEVANELGRPELLTILDTIPSMSDREALTSVMKQISDFADGAVKKREQELLAGVTPAAAQVAETPLPGTDDGWNKLINSQPLGSADRQKAMDSYWEWLQHNNS